MQIYGNRLKEYRKREGLTQLEVAEMLSMPQSNYSRLEKGEQDIKLSMILHICSTLNLSTDWFLGITPETESNPPSITGFYKEVIDIICRYGDEDLIADKIVTELTHEIDRISFKYDID